MKIGHKVFTTNSPIMVFLNVLCYFINANALYMTWVSSNEFDSIVIAMVVTSVSLCSVALYVLVDVVEEDITVNNLIVGDLSVKRLKVDNIKENSLE